LLLPELVDHGVAVVTIGKIYDLYAGQGITDRHRAKGNAEGMATLSSLYLAPQGPPTALYMVNLVDFDMLWGHRNDPEGMAAGLACFDGWLAGFLGNLRAEDLLLITADHGNDPTTPSTDHSREYVPLLARYGRGSSGADLGTRDSLADVGATLAEFFGLAPPAAGQSLLPDIEVECEEDDLT
jgi:phosphopentomutase